MESTQCNRVDQGSAFHRSQNKSHLYWDDSLGPTLLDPRDICGLYLLQQHQWYLFEDEGLRSTLPVITCFSSTSPQLHLNINAHKEAVTNLFYLIATRGGYTQPAASSTISVPATTSAFSNWYAIRHASRSCLLPWYSPSSSLLLTSVLWPTASVLASPSELTHFGSWHSCSSCWRTQLSLMTSRPH